MIYKSVYQFLIPFFIFLRARFNKRSSSQLHEVERGITGGDERGALPSGPLNITEEVATTNQQDDSAEHAPLGAEEKVQYLII